MNSDNFECQAQPPCTSTRGFSLAPLILVSQLRIWLSWYIVKVICTLLSLPRSKSYTGAGKLADSRLLTAHCLSNLSNL